MPQGAWSFFWVSVILLLTWSFQAASTHNESGLLGLKKLASGSYSAESSRFLMARADALSGERG